MSFKKTICLDFDGVLHSYSSGWKGASVASDKPVDGAIEYLRALIEDDRFEVCIYSSRSKYPEGVDAMAVWLIRHGLDDDELSQISFPTQKPAAFLSIDDRCFHFQGVFPELDDVANFVPWNK